jgi:hypothetical protein
MDTDDFEAFRQFVFAELDYVEKNCKYDRFTLENISAARKSIRLFAKEIEEKYAVNSASTAPTKKCICYCGNEHEIDDDVL